MIALVTDWRHVTAFVSPPRGVPAHTAIDAKRLLSTQIRALGVRTCAVLLIVMVCLSLTGAVATPNFRKAPQEPIKICVLNSPPNLSTKHGISITDGVLMSSAEASVALQGIGLDLTEVVFGQYLQWDYTVRVYDPSTTCFSHVAYKVRWGEECDVGIQSFFIFAARDMCLDTCQSMPINTTIRSCDNDYEAYLCCLDFSYAYYTGGWSFMSRSSQGGAVNYLHVFFQRDIVQAICVCIIAMFFVSHVIWLLERTQYGKSVLLTNPKEGFSRFYLDGLKDGVWFSTSTLMNGVVNSEKTIITPFGRMLVTVWVLFGILMSAFITAVIAASLTTASLTTSSISTANDVAGKTVCLTTYNYEFFQASFPGIGIKQFIVGTTDLCYPLLRDGTVDVVFSTREQAISHFAAGNGAGLMLSPVVKPQSYGIIWTESWAYSSWVNEAILAWQQNTMASKPSFVESTSRWYPGDPRDVTYGGDVPASSLSFNWPLITVAIVCVLLYIGLQGIVMASHWLTSRRASANVKSTNAFERIVSTIAAPSDAYDVEDPDQARSFGRSFHAGRLNTPTIRRESTKVSPAPDAIAEISAKLSTIHAIIMTMKQQPEPEPELEPQQQSAVTFFIKSHRADEQENSSV